MARLSTSRICKRDFGRDAQRVCLRSMQSLLAETKRRVRLATTISQTCITSRIQFFLHQFSQFLRRSYLPLVRAVSITNYKNLFSLKLVQMHCFESERHMITMKSHLTVIQSPQLFTLLVQH